MGGLLSRAEDDVPAGLVLVPPLFERDFRGRSRMTKSAYDWQFGKPGLKWLFNDYIKPDDAYGLFRFRPSEDPRLTVHARIGASLPKKRSANGSRTAGLPRRAAGADGASWGRMALRFQPDVDEPLTFGDIKTGTGGLGAVARACFFNVSHGAGVFAVLPLAGGPATEAAVGARYSSPTASVGVVAHPLSQRLAQAWVVGRSGPFCFGWQLTPRGDLLDGAGRSDAAGLLERLHSASSYAVSYSPEAGRSNFETAVELAGARRLAVSLLWHAAVQRLCKNPLEDESVVGITNYLNLGLQVVTDLAEGVDGSAREAAAESHLRLGASWQVNKNWLVKGRVGSDAAAGALVLKAWWQPSLTLGLSAVYSFAARLPRLGLTLALENYGNIRYERSAAPTRVGKALVQRHVALPEDLANRDGQGLLVREKDLTNKAILGQVQASSARYL